MSERIDYESAGWEAASQVLLENSRRLSRTRQGISDTSTSDDKDPLRVSGEELKQRSKENELNVHRYLFDRALHWNATSGEDVKTVLFAFCDLANAGLLPEGSGRFRTWPIVGKAYQVEGVERMASDKIPPEDLEQETDAFCDTIHDRWSELAEDPVPLAAWAEWELNGGLLHPFYDGCGRISRAFGAMLLVHAGSALPVYENSEQYFQVGNAGLDEFIAYVRERLRPVPK